VGIRFVRGKVVPRPEQLLNTSQAESMKVDEVTRSDDARYDAMTDEERRAYYVSPSLGTKVKRFLRGY
jgi:hypothetical protein